MTAILATLGILFVGFVLTAAALLARDLIADVRHHMTRGDLP